MMNVHLSLKFFAHKCTRGIVRAGDSRRAKSEDKRMRIEIERRAIAVGMEPERELD